MGQFRSQGCAVSHEERVAEGREGKTCVSLLSALCCLCVFSLFNGGGPSVRSLLSPSFHILGGENTTLSVHLATRGCSWSSITLGPLLELVLSTSTLSVSGVLPLEAGTAALWMVFERDLEEGKFMAESHVPTCCPSHLKLG